jgi:hypothetical protein
MKTIAWVNVLERDLDTDDDSKVINSYPFPEVNIKGHWCLSIWQLKELIDKMEDEIMKECYHTRLHFIMNRWHPKNFINIEFKNWKYED